MRPRDSHKGDYGKVLLLCGSSGLTGAAVLAAKAALRTGIGLVYLGVPEAVYPIVAAQAMSEIVFPLPCRQDGILSEEAWPLLEKRLPDMDAVLFGVPMLRCASVRYSIDAPRSRATSRVRDSRDLKTESFSRRARIARGSV